MSQDAWNPNQYEKFKEERSQPFFDLMNMLEAPESRVEVIDLGCGTGELTAELHHFLRADHTVGLDSSDQMLERAYHFKEDNLKFVKGDIQTWKPTQEYDVIFSNAAIQWCSDHPALFANLKNALRTRGQLAVQMPMNHDYPTHVLAATMSREEPWKSLLKEPYEPAGTMLTAEGYAELMFKLGFGRQKVLVQVYSHILESREGVVEWVKGTLLTRFEKQLSPTDYQKFLAEFKRRLFAQLPDDRPFFYPFKRVLIWGRL